MENRNTNNTTKNYNQDITYEELIDQLDAISISLQSYTDYPQGATNNAKRALEWVEKNGWGSCGEATGKKKSPPNRKQTAYFKRYNCTHGII